MLVGSTVGVGSIVGSGVGVVELVGSGVGVVVLVGSGDAVTVGSGVGEAVGSGVGVTVWEATKGTKAKMRKLIIVNAICFFMYSPSKYVKQLRNRSMCLLAE